MVIARDIFTNPMSTAFAMGHLAKDAAVRTENSFDRIDGLVRVETGIHSSLALVVHVLSSYLAILSQRRYLVWACYKTTFSMRNRNGEDVTGFYSRHPRGHGGNNLGVYHAG